MHCWKIKMVHKSSKRMNMSMSKSDPSHINLKLRVFEKTICTRPYRDHDPSFDIIHPCFCMADYMTSQRFVLAPLSTCYIILWLLSERGILGFIFHLLTEGVSACRLENGLVCYNEISWTADCFQSKYTTQFMRMKRMYSANL